MKKFPVIFQFKAWLYQSQIAACGELNRHVFKYCRIFVCDTYSRKKEAMQTLEARRKILKP